MPRRRPCCPVGYIRPKAIYPHKLTHWHPSPPLPPFFPPSHPSASASALTEDSEDEDPKESRKRLLRALTEDSEDEDSQESRKRSSSSTEPYRPNQEHDEMEHQMQRFDDALSKFKKSRKVFAKAEAEPERVELEDDSDDESMRITVEDSSDEEDTDDKDWKEIGSDDDVFSDAGDEEIQALPSVEPEEDVAKVLADAKTVAEEALRRVSDTLLAFKFRYSDVVKCVIQARAKAIEPIGTHEDQTGEEDLEEYAMDLIGSYLASIGAPTSL